MQVRVTVSIIQKRNSRCRWRSWRRGLEKQALAPVPDAVPSSCHLLSPRFGSHAQNKLQLVSGPAAGPALTILVMLSQASGPRALAGKSGLP